MVCTTTFGCKQILECLFLFSPINSAGDWWATAVSTPCDGDARCMGFREVHCWPGQGRKCWKSEETWSWLWNVDTRQLGHIGDMTWPSLGQEHVGGYSTMSQNCKSTKTIQDDLQRSTLIIFWVQLSYLKILYKKIIQTYTIALKKFSFSLLK